MKRVQLPRWSGSVLSPRTRTAHSSRLQRHLVTITRPQSSASPALFSESEHVPHPDPSILNQPQRTPQDFSHLPSPPKEAALDSAKLSALHARLSLPKRLPLETLARTLVDYSADPNPGFNNRPFSILGHDLLSYYTSEHLLCKYPRLPMSVIFAAMYAYVGSKSLSAMTREWGVEHAAEPGGEVDPGYLQFRRVDAGEPNKKPVKGSLRRYEQHQSWRRGLNSRVVYDDEFGDPQSRQEEKLAEGQLPDGVTAEQASTVFVRAVMGAIYLHAGRPAAKTFFQEHFLSRQLDMSQLFNFSQPTRDLNRLCAREGFEAPIAKILSETGRQSRSPVFTVAIDSGTDRLGEGSGGSLEEARFRAAVAAMKGWYLYSPLKARVPSSMEERGAEPWAPVHVDQGEIIV
ncbi:hypothetical protein FQN54_009003 [Arachnomyces sp. PD_36]|nr:hypothetical protein FQN54_009003 [Arachnomyces sp. PD_36]